MPEARSEFRLGNGKCRHGWQLQDLVAGTPYRLRDTLRILVLRSSSQFCRNVPTVDAAGNFIVQSRRRSAVIACRRTHEQLEPQHYSPHDLDRMLWPHEELMPPPRTSLCDGKYSNRPLHKLDDFTVVAAFDYVGCAVSDIFQLPELAGPLSVRQLSRRMCIHHGGTIERQLFEAFFRLAVVALFVTLGGERSDDISDSMILARGFNRPIHARLPPTIRVARCPSDAIVVDRSRAGYLVILVGQFGKQIRETHFDNSPFCLPHSIQARAEASISPASLLGTGLSPVMASNAQNQ